jgi:hypothetical protein
LRDIICAPRFVRGVWLVPWPCVCFPNCEADCKRSGPGEADMEAENQIRISQSDVTEECIAERHLWTAVVTRALEDWRAGTLRERRAAQKFLFDEANDFDRVCASAGLDPASLRSQLSKIGRRINMEGPWSSSMAA